MTYAHAARVARRTRPWAWFCGVCALLIAGPSLADPALWVVEGAHAKIYLFGTIHILRPGQPWRSPQLVKALAESQGLWLEVANADDAGAAVPYVRSLGFDAAHPLSTKLTPADVARVDAAAKAMGVPRGEAALEPMRPWLAAVTLSIVPVIKAGYDPKSGVEPALKAMAVAQGKPVGGLETLGDQLHFLADLPPDQEMALLRTTLDDIADEASETDELVKAWAAGDVDKVAALSDDNMKTEAPELYRRLLTQRNQNWAGLLDARLRGDGVSFVAVGAGHLAGPDSLQHDLEARGYKVRRIN